MRALHDRAAHRDFIDVYAAATRGGYTRADLERLAAAHTPHVAVGDLADRLEAVELRDERYFRAYGLGEPEIAAISRWALAWAREIRSRDRDAGRSGEAPQHDWDAYLDEGER